MYNLLVVDDEPLILESLYRMMMKKRGEQFLVFRAGSAAEALAVFEANRIDLLMTDISMPGMDGLVLRDTVLESWPDCLTIFLTGQEEFGYAREAVDVRTIAFVLKVEGDEVLLQAVDKGFERLEELYDRKGQLLKLNTHFKETLPILKQYCARKIINAGEWTQEYEKKLQKELDAAGAHFLMDKKLLIAICQISQEDKLIQEEIRNICEESVRGAFEILTSFVDQDICVILAQDKSRENSTDRMKGFLEIGLHLCGKVGYGSPSILLYDRAVEICQAAQAFSTLTYRRLEMDAQEGIRICGPKGTLSAFTWEKREKVTYGFRPEDMSECLVRGDEEQFYLCMERIAQWADSTGDAGRAAVFALASSQLLWAVLNYLPDESQMEEKINIEKLVNYSIHSGFRQAMGYLNQSAGVYFSARRSVRTDAKGYLVHQVNSYIQKNIEEELSMVILGNLVGLNATYLSRVYKDTTGESINQYIVNHRIGRAKQLLEDASVKVQKIAELTGLRTSSYFTHYFKKHTGLTPQEYRSRVMSVEDRKMNGTVGRQAHEILLLDEEMNVDIADSREGVGAE